jgi:hypothetical protein
VRRAAALLGAVVLAGACGQAAAPTASQSPSPTAVATPIDVTLNAPLIFFRDAANFDQIDATTWSGVVGKAPAGMPDYHSANPQETLFGSSTDIRDRNNEPVAKGLFGPKSFAATWADDGIHYCVMQPFDVLGAEGVPATLMVGSVEGGRQVVVQVGKVYEQGSIHVAGCAFEGDRAVVVQSGGQGVGVADYWVVQVSTGKVLWSRSFGTDHAPMSVVVSHDGRYLAENYDAGNAVQTSTVYGPAGEKLKDLDGAVVAFSWDETTVVMTSRAGLKPPALATFDGRILWIPPAKPGIYAWAAVAEPGGDRIAVAIADPETSNASSTWMGFPVVDLYVLHPDGSVVKVLKGVRW